MSGIIGMRRAPGSGGLQVLEPTLRLMAASLAHRGPDGTHFWAEESVGPGAGVALGHLALHATPEAHAETIPLRCERKSLVLTCDARLDNRDELLRELRHELEQVLGAAPSEPLIGDSTLILAAYARWNRECAEHLLGDFAFAIWDGRAQQLFCARDHVGVKPFYYFHEPGLFAFASEVKALLEVPGVPRQLDEERIAKYLMVAFDSFEDTAFECIRRLPPAHTLTLSEGGLEIERYWNLKSVPMLRGLSDSEYEQRFREVLFEAVRCRMRAPRARNALGGFLSGGLDSSAVMCVARRIESEKREPERLPVFSAIFEAVPECDERPFIQAVLDGGGLAPHWIRGEERSPLTDLERVLWHTDEPILGANLCSAWTHYKPARQAGVRVLLDGHGGDETVGYGLARLSELVQAGAWRVLWRELKLMERNGFLAGGPGAARIMRRSLGHALKPLRLARRLQQGVARRLPRNNRSQGENVARAGEKPEWKRLMNLNFATRIEAEPMQRRARVAEPRNTDGDRKFNESTLSLPLQALAFEELNKAAAANGLEARYPLWDKRLVELCLSLPSEQKLRNGWTRSILRRALQDVLPPEVQWRGSKVDFTPEACHGLRTREQPWLQRALAGEMPNSASYIDLDEVRRCASGVLEVEGEAPTPGSLQTLVRAISLEAWLQLQRASGSLESEPGQPEAEFQSEPVASEAERAPSFEVARV